MESKQQQVIPIYSQRDIAGIRAACKLGREVLDACVRAVAPGVTTDEIDKIAHDVTIAGGGYPSPLNYCHFPKSCCTSVNEVICHGIPDERKLEEGDIVNLDISVFLDGYHGDLNETVLVGAVDAPGRHLVKAALECLERAIALIKPGARFRDVGDVITKHAAANGLAVVRTYCGHGIGEHFHCAPSIPHYANNKAVGVMKPGMIFTIEPMINIGTWRDITWPDGVRARAQRRGGGEGGRGERAQACAAPCMSAAAVYRRAPHGASNGGAPLSQVCLSRMHLANSFLHPPARLPGWTSVTQDGKRSAQFEHTMLVTEDGVDILTARLPESPAVFPFAS